MFRLFQTDSLAFAPSAGGATPNAGGYGPEWDPTFNTPQGNGGDNPWAGDPYGPEWDADNNTPQDDGGYNPWAPGYDGGVWG